jgi:hypothetical protein
MIDLWAGAKQPSQESCYFVVCTTDMRQWPKGILEETLGTTGKALGTQFHVKAEM